MRNYFIQNFIDILRGKKKKPNNKIITDKIDLLKFSDVRVNIVGDNNLIKIDKIFEKGFTGELIIGIKASNCSVNIDKGLHITSKLHININNVSETDEELKNVHINIGKNVYIEDIAITTYQSNNNIIVGDNCLFSSGINLYNTDGHPIYDKDSGHLINYVKDMKIGDNCWIGKNVTILKNVNIPDGTIIGWGAVVAKSIDKPYCAIAGNPAKIIKENISWKRSGDKDSVKNIKF